MDKAEGCSELLLQIHRKFVAPSELTRMFEIDRVVAFILTGCDPHLRNGQVGELSTPIKRVALQFPDSLLHFAASVVHLIRDELRKISETYDEAIKLFVLADCTFSSCCPDEITAQHYTADCIVHFGPTCLSRSRRLPVLDIVQRAVVDVTVSAARICDCYSSLRAVLAQSALSAQLIVIVTPRAHHAMEALIVAVQQRVVELRLNATVCMAFDSSVAEGSAIVFASRDSAAAADTSFRWRINGLSFPVENPQREVQCMFLVGLPEETLLNQLALVISSNSACRPENFTALDNLYPLEFFNVEQHSDPEKDEKIIAARRVVDVRLRRRVFLVDKVRDSSVVGIVVASLAIEGYREIVEKLRRVLLHHGKRCYVLYIGSLNPFKVGNFADSIDCFVVVSCPNSLEGNFASNQQGFFKPMVAPIEVFLAFGYAPYDCLAGYTTSFHPALRVDETLPDGGEEAEDFMLPSEGALVQSDRAVRAPLGSAIARLHQRAFCGLDPKIGQTAVQPSVVEGRAGFAQGYDDEGK